MAGNDPSESSSVASTRPNERLTAEVYTPPPAHAAPFPRPPSSATGSTSDELPRELGSYRLLRKIHQGGMGVVYEALHLHLGRSVALKTLRSDRLRDPHLNARFQREMAIIGRLTHPNVVHATDAGDADGALFLVMDLVEGLDLSELVQRGGPLSIADACEVVRQAALALEHIHQHELVHRDVKPSNLMLAADGTVKLLDLGLALLREGAEADERLSSMGVALGTADYMAPEQVRDSHSVDIRADLYSLGCTLYKLLTGRPPFGSGEYSTVERKMRAHAEEIPRPVTDFRPEIPAEVGAILQRLLAKHPEERFERPEDLARAVEPYTPGCNLLGCLNAALSESMRHTVPFSPSPTGGKNRTDPLEKSTATTPRHKNWMRAIIPVGAGIVLGGLVASLALIPLLLRLQDSASNAATRTEPVVLNWPNDYPEAMRERPWLQPLDLLYAQPDRVELIDPTGTRAARANPKPAPEPLYQPNWRRRLYGTGRFVPFHDELQIWSNDSKATGRCTLLALDDDLRRRWFDLEAELPRYRNDVHKNPRGLFFGWQLLQPEKAVAYFVYLDQKPDHPAGAPHGRLVVGPATLSLRTTADTEEIVAPLAPYQGNLPLLQRLPEPGQIYRVRITVRPGKVRIQLNGEPALEFVPAFDPRGPLGIWVQDGGGRFRKISITALPES